MLTKGLIKLIGLMNPDGGWPSGGMNLPLLIGVEAPVSRPSSSSSSMHAPNRVFRCCVVPRDGDIGGCNAAVRRDSKGQITIRVEESPIVRVKELQAQGE